MADTSGTVEAPITHDGTQTQADAWAQLDSMTGMWTGQFDDQGGAESFVRWLRDEDAS